MTIVLGDNPNINHVLTVTVPLEAKKSVHAETYGLVDSKQEYRSARDLGLPPQHDVDIQGNHHIDASKFKFLDTTKNVLYFRYGFKPRVTSAVPYPGVNLTVSEIRRLLGDPQWEPALKSETDEDIFDDDVSLFWGYFSRARKLADIPAELYELRQQGSAALRPSPIQLHWETIGGTTYYFLSPKTQSGMTGAVVLHSAAAAIEVLRRDWIKMELVALNLADRGIPFNTFLPGSPPPSSSTSEPVVPPSYRGFGIRSTGFKATLSDYRIYESARNRIFRSRRGRRALMMGGIVARLANGIADLQSVCRVPTKSGDVDGCCIWDGLPTSPVWEDSFTQQEHDIICGLYEVETGLADNLRPDGKQKKFVSWWPPTSVWKSCSLEMGYWTPSCEEWFQSRLAEICSGNAQLHNRIEWKQILGMNQPQTNDRLAAEFLAENGTRIAAGPPQQSSRALHKPNAPSLQLRRSLIMKKRPNPFPSKPPVNLIETLKQPEVQQLTRQYWDLRRNITALALRGETIERDLRNLHVNDPSLYLTTSDLSRRLTTAERELTEERNRSCKADRILEDIRRECKTPTVIPLLLSTLSTFLED
ncbi:hypothetical protein MSAN_00173200 [Mycena sanguinolenta]|uniref:Uncharacterized protein n=1 Tax=Mycena sanguinolenta TaxID=230812 RepID=A0A8H6ZJH5_9AGAR|nr:hypothetical protein MSAN_00173200 [Mycena sanguinolenta]